MTESLADDWIIANQKYLSSALAIVKINLEKYAAIPDEQGFYAEKELLLQQQLHEAADAMLDGSPLDTICRTFNLSPFECNILLLCAGMELDSAFSSLCADAQGDPAKPYPTFGLALALFPGAHWSALSPGSPLRHWQLIDIGPGSPFTKNPLRIDERVLHYLTGVNHPDDRLSGIIEPLQTSGVNVPSHSALAGQIASVWSAARDSHDLPVIFLNGRDETAKRSIALAACAVMGLTLSGIVSSIPVIPSERETFIRLWEREAVFTSSALFLDCGSDTVVDPAHEQAITHLIEHIHGPLVISANERRFEGSKSVITFNVEKPTPHEQFELWCNVLCQFEEQFDEGLKELVSQFNMSAPDISSAGIEAVEMLSSTDEGNNKDPDEFRSIMHRICCRRVRLRLHDLAQRIEPMATWDDIVLPEHQILTLREITMHIRQKEKVFTDWGFAKKGLRGLGTFALFTGASGTGKTMAAEVLAHDLQLDLFRIDLSQVVSKYIGETEKNLRRVFDAAEEGGVILLFDEADALFGKRSEVKDSHDRYANIEISYLLQRMEAYRGLAILTTNMKSALDPAFIRRIPFIVQFPFPDDRQRREIWQKIFPKETPKKDLDYQKLARLTVTGGNIRNISLNAAFLAADADDQVTMGYLLKAVRSEYTKLEKPLTEAEIGGWR